MRPSFANNYPRKRGRRECRVRDAPAVSRAKSGKHTRSSPQVHRSNRHSPRNGFNGLLRDLVSAESDRMCERAVLTNRPSLDLSPFVLKGLGEPDGERGTDPVSSSTRTVAGASSPDRARKGAG